MIVWSSEIAWFLQFNIHLIADNRKGGIIPPIQLYGLIYLLYRFKEIDFHNYLKRIRLLILAKNDVFSLIPLNISAPGP